MYAKTLYKPKRPDYINEKIKNFTNMNLPHFFTYAKDKEKNQVEKPNKSFVNKLENNIKDVRINCRKLGLKNIDYKLMVSNPNIECNVEFNKNGTLNENKTDPMIVKYCELNKKYHFKLENTSYRIDALDNQNLLEQVIFGEIKKEIKYELSKFGYSDNEICDILVKFLYDVKPSTHKRSLWFCYGDIIVNNLKNHFKIPTKTIECIDCGDWFEVNLKDNNTCRCPKCYNEYRKEYYKIKKREQRQKMKNNNKQ